MVPHAEHASTWKAPPLATTGARLPTLAAFFRDLVESETNSAVADWPALIAMAALEQLTPTFASLPHWSTCAETIPAPVRDYFEAALFLNAQRNELMLQTLLRAVAALEQEGLQPLVLKGAVSLVTGLYTHPGARMLGDLDILVPEARVPDAAVILTHAGFEAPPAPVARRWVPLRRHDAPLQRHLTTGAGVDIHRRISVFGDPVILDAEVVRERAEIRIFRGVAIRIPCATDRLVHLILHDQVSDRNAVRGQIRLRTIIETALLARRESIDWQAAGTAFGSGRWRAAFLRVCALSEAWIGAPIPIEARCEAGAAIDWLERGRPKALAAMAIQSLLVARLFRSQPLVFLNMLQPSWIISNLQRQLGRMMPPSRPR